MSGFVAYGGAHPIREPPPAPQPGSIWRTLRHRVFFWLTLAALVSNVGTWMQNVGAAWLMTSLSSSPLMVALIQTASSLPILLLALPAGALADIVDRRRLLLFSQGWMLVAAALLGALTIAHLTTPWSLLALSLALGAGSAMNAPAWQAIVPELVPRQELTPAISLGSISFNLSRAVGPALGGLVVAWAGVGATFLLNAASFLAVMAVLYEWDRPRSTNVLPAERVLGAIKAGIRYMRFAPDLDAVLVRTGRPLPSAPARCGRCCRFTRAGSWISAQPDTADCRDASGPVRWWPEPDCRAWVSGCRATQSAGWPPPFLPWDCWDWPNLTIWSWSVS